MSDETGGPAGPEPGTDPGAQGAEAPVGPPATVPPATAPPVEATGGAGATRPRWVTAVVAGLAVLALLAAGFGIGRWTDSGGDHDRLRFLGGPGRGVPFGGRDGRGFGGPGGGGPAGGPRFHFDGPGFGGDGDGPGGGFGPRGRFPQNGSGSSSTTTTTQPSSLQ
ncbi:MAG TPA: hypothetical protein VFC99_17255 [Acidimicrobiia bacterium]|nr:hypothetical protein [Acidimicrobiia bacterium]